MEADSVPPLVIHAPSIHMGGGLVLLSYAIHRRDPVFILGQTTGVFIYLRNLWFIYFGDDKE